VSGESGHAAKPETGVSAVECMVRFLAEVDRKYRKLYYTGENASHCVLHIWNDYPTYSLNIPDTCHALLNKQLLTTENAQQFQQELQDLFAALCPEASLTIQRRQPYYPAYHTDPDHPCFQRLKAIAERHRGSPVDLVVNQSVSDGNIIEPVMGIPTVTFGPKGIGCHKPDEYLVLESVLPYIDILDEFLSS